MYTQNYRIYAQDDIEHDSLLDSMPLDILGTMYDENEVPVYYHKFATPHGDDIKELKDKIEEMKRAFNLPILSKKNFPNIYE